MTQNSSECHVSIPDAALFLHEFYIQAPITHFCCTLHLPKRSCYCLGPALSIVTVHLLLNRFGESHNRAGRNSCSEVDARIRGTHQPKEPPGEVLLLFQWLFVALRMEKVSSMWAPARHCLNLLLWGKQRTLAGV